MKWVNLDGIWHLVASTAIRGNNYEVITSCDLHRIWDGTGLDALPGGSEVSCESCVPLVSVVKVAPKPKKRTKKG
jgi:hypothetical protein